MKIAGILVAAFCVALSLARAVHADGCMFPRMEDWKRLRERALINEVDQKAVILFRDGRQDLIISPSYQGPAAGFAWVVPVPARPQVAIVKGALFHELAELVMPRPPAPGAADAAAAAPAARKSAVQVLERKTVGAYDVSVLAASDGQALVKWLAANRYYLPPNAVRPIREYVREKWTFVACRIKAPQSARGLSSGTLAPLRLTFPTRRPVYPMRLSQVNPEPFKVLLYVLLPTRDYGIGTRLKTVAQPAVRRGSHYNQATRGIRLQRAQSRLPTLARLNREEMRVFLGRGQFRPGDCVRDFVWSLPPAGEDVAVATARQGKP